MKACQIKQLTEVTVRKLQNMSWPGNIRQLKNTIERALILGRSKTDIYPMIFLNLWRQKKTTCTIMFWILVAIFLQINLFDLQEKNLKELI